MRRAYVADIVLIIHFLFTLFAVLGGFMILFDWRIALLHIPAVIWSSVVNLASWTCPLTPLEQRFRRSVGQKAFEGGWIQHYFDPLVRPLGMPRNMELIAGVSIALWNLIVYSIVLW